MLVKDHRYDCIETGSLISIKKNVGHILIPSEEEKETMYPMDYEEFYQAVYWMNMSVLRKFYAKKMPPGSAHHKAMRDFRLYMLVGGMPQAVKAYLDTNNFRNVDEVKREILNLYFDDFNKIDQTGKTKKRASPAK